MAYQALLLGAVENDGTGDTLRVGGAKINSNFTELYGNFPVAYADITGAPTTFAFADLTGVPAFALLASPAFSGVPAAPTAVKATNTTQLATTAFVQSQSDTPTFTGVVTVPTPAGADNSNTVATTAFVKALGYAPIASPTFTGLPAAPTASLGNNTTQLATTAFVAATKVVIDNAIALKANLASPVLTGTPTAPTAAPNTNTLQLATTAFVEAVRVVLNAAIALKSNIISPAFTGVPTAPTAAPATNTTQLATTAFVQAAVPLKCVLSETLGVNANSGASLAGSNIRVLNTQTGNTTFATIVGSNTFTLTAGTYEVDWRAPNTEGAQHVAVLENTTDTLSYFGSAAFGSASADRAQTDSIGTATFTIAATKTFRLNHFIAVAKGINGLGVYFPGATSNVYTQVKIAKVS